MPSRQPNVLRNVLDANGEPALPIFHPGYARVEFMIARSGFLLLKTGPAEVKRNGVGFSYRDERGIGD